MIIDYTRPEKPLRHDPLKAIVGPRPIGWISTRGADGATNVAPYSFFQLVSVSPGVVMFSSDGEKHTLRNIRREKEFVCNFTTAEMLASVNGSSGAFPDAQAKARACGIGFVPSARIATPRVAGVPAAIECRLVGMHGVEDLTGEKSSWTMVLGTVVAVYIDDTHIDGGIFMAHRLRPLLRAGYRYYAIGTDHVEVRRPSEVERSY